MYSSLNLLPLIDTSNGKVLEKPETDNCNQILIRLLCLRISKKQRSHFRATLHTNAYANHKIGYNNFEYVFIFPLKFVMYICLKGSRFLLIPIYREQNVEHVSFKHLHFDNTKSDRV